MIPIEAGAKPMFNEKPVLTIQDDGQHFAVVGLALSLEPGTYTLDNVGRQLTFEVFPKKYLEQRIYLENSGSDSKYTRFRAHQKWIYEATESSTRLTELSIQLA